MGDEIDPRPLMGRLHESGHVCALPVVAAKGEPLRFRAWSPGMTLQLKAFGLSEPPPEAAIVIPELLLVPLLAFDAGGYRLGYGGGYFDRTLTRLRDSDAVLAVGVAYAAQEVAEVPRDGSDQPLDWIVTEAESIRMRADAS